MQKEAPAAWLKGAADADLRSPETDGLMHDPRTDYDPREEVSQ
jgi:hypothetical protein